MYQKRVVTVFQSLLLVSLIGCGGDTLDLVPVSGTVLLDGKPLTKLGQGGVSFYGDAPLGAYKIVVNAFQNTPDEGPVTPRQLLNSRYYDPAKTDLKIEVVAESVPGQYDLNVSKK